MCKCKCLEPYTHVFRDDNVPFYESKDNLNNKSSTEKEIRSTENYMILSKKK